LFIVVAFFVSPNGNRLRAWAACARSPARGSRDPRPFGEDGEEAVDVLINLAGILIAVFG
jgi:hypothetical protein